MWKCKKCNEEIEDSFDSCWKCGTEHSGVSSNNPQELKGKKDKTTKDIQAPEKYISTYGTTRTITKLLSFLGWLNIVLGLLISLIVAIKSPLFNWSTLLPAVGGLIIGLHLVISGQIIRATVDSADNTGQILTLLKNRTIK
ncbi:MAG: hypothetical protein PF445_12560 [Melioribacteraceae bacterium]|jgi:hypothetical protein|nr:hypothetical protein [Melioribacteraceae bacterium]